MQHVVWKMPLATTCRNFNPGVFLPPEMARHFLESYRRPAKKGLQLMENPVQTGRVDATVAHAQFLQGSSTGHGRILCSGLSGAASDGDNSRLAFAGPF